MAEYVRIQKGGKDLSVSRKAFESVYREKGFALAAASSAPAESEAETSKQSEASTAGKAGSGKTAGKGKGRRKSAARASKTKAAGQVDGSDKAPADNDGDPTDLTDAT